ncbi:MAG TPA: ATP-binding protein, partial [Thermodesulfobacteriota bacterium]|nr:ATP-binding protein [Thermodesulfobacteriota bacterium]
GRPYINLSVKFPLLDVTGTPMEICGISTDITDRELAKEALRESEDRYRRLFENLNSAFLLCQPILNKEGRLVDLKYLMANPAVSRHLNKEPEEMVSKLYSEVFHYTAPNPVFNIYEQVLSTGEPYKGEILLPALNRHYDMAVFCPAKGQLALVLSDITEAKQAEETSIAEAQRLAVVLDAQREISGANLDYGDLRQLILDRMTRLLSADGACLEIAEDDEMVYEEGTGLAAGFVGLRLKTAGSLSGLSMESNQLLRTDDTENDPRVDREACRRIGLRSMIVVPLRYGESLYGVLKLMSARVSAFTADMEQTLRLMGEFLGVTIGRQRALDALRESEEKFRVFAENTDIQIIITTVPEGKVLYTNPSFETMYLYTGGELVGSKTPDLYYNLGEREQILYELQTKGFINSFEMKGKRKDGSWFWNSLTSRVVELDRHKVAITGAVDITARKQAEEALRKAHDELEIRVQERTAELSETVTRLEKANEELEEFAYIASHDLQEPLRKIQTFGDMAKKRCAPIADKTGQDYLDRVLQSAGRMRQLLQELLTLSRVTSQKKPFEKIELNKTVGEAADVFEAVLKETGGKITIENLPTIEADESQMRQLFQNLIGNALKFRDDQIPLVKIHGRVIDQDLCELVVSDSGIGFDPQFAESIFKPFERLHGRSNYEGTGMGLAICRKIVERHGGTIRAESEPGKGTTFFIRLPLKQKEREIH